jgi:hypothetical protein
MRGKEPLIDYKKLHTVTLDEYLSISHLKNSKKGSCPRN